MVHPSFHFLYKKSCFAGRMGAATLGGANQPLGRGETKVELKYFSFSSTLPPSGLSLPFQNEKEERRERGEGRSSPANLCMQAPPAKLARFSLCENFACRCASAKRRAKVNLKNFKHFCIFTKRS